MSLVIALLGALRASLRTRTDLALENLALRQQLVLLRRRSKRPQFGRLDRLFWLWLSHQWAGWRGALHVVRPQTVIRWHRQGFRAFWTWKSRRGLVGRPPVSPELAELVRTMALANPWPRSLAAHGCPAHAAPPEVTLSDLAHVPPEPRLRPGLRRLLRRADGNLPRALRVRGAAASSPKGRALQRN